MHHTPRQQLICCIEWFCTSNVFLYSQTKCSNQNRFKCYAIANLDAMWERVQPYWKYLVSQCSALICDFSFPTPHENISRGRGGICRPPHPPWCFDLWFLSISWIINKHRTEHETEHFPVGRNSLIIALVASVVSSDWKHLWIDVRDLLVSGMWEIFVLQRWQRQLLLKCDIAVECQGGPQVLSGILCCSIVLTAVGTVQ